MSIRHIQEEQYKVSADCISVEFKYGDQAFKYKTEHSPFIDSI